ncbi:hypothetical protein ED733_008985 [Metarhizium rileyi]|uniref:Rhodopsin domain-containing protein n=1 Tax=Metarhizium rileyi (strain RCEF 4871) TaxID=1649241 RepID=A0A5C6GQJ9_METRR|nr:hypothetical protein ED733_008985 [Metarhizium rileyi]
MRLIFKQLFSYHKALRSDDWVILASIVVGLPCTILNIVGLTHNGLGKDVWTLRPGQVVEFATYFFSQQILYLFLMTSIKISLLCFYLTLFPGRTTRILLWVSVGVVLAFGICSVFVSIFQCTPVRYYWMQYVQQEGGECLNINLLGWINGGVSVAIDVWMIGIPLFQIRKLELHWKKKIGATIMFLTGTFVTVVSILRLQSLLYFFSSDNPTWDLWHTAWWSTLEINVGLICACLPTIRLILVRVWPRVFGSTVNSTSARSKTSGRHSILPRKQQVRIPSTEIQLEDASSLTEATEERWEESAQRPREQYDYSRSHARRLKLHLQQKGIGRQVKLMIPKILRQRQIEYGQKTAADDNEKGNGPIGPAGGVNMADNCEASNMTATLVTQWPIVHRSSFLCLTANSNLVDCPRQHQAKT